jgi:prolyl 4-hydroxylase
VAGDRGFGRIETLSFDPLVVIIHGFVSELEAGELVAAADGRFARSGVVCDKPGGRCIDPARTSESAHLGDDPRCEPVRQRAMRFARLASCEPIQVVRYGPGQEYRPHLDQFSEQLDAGRREIARGGQRGATFLVYLVRPEIGGATIFPKLGLAVPPIPMAAVYWTHQLPSGHTDERTLHGGAPVLAGVKYAANVWLRRPA